MRYDRFTGKPADRTSDHLPSQLEEKCERCGTNLINRCLQCGAPVCCPKCCDEVTSDVELSAGLDAKLSGMIDTAYCLYIEQMRQPACLGWEANVRIGQFGSDNLEAFMRAAEMLGRYKALAEAAQMVRAAASNAD